MVLRSGIIIPFQFRDNKKLLMIGVPEENRNLNIWDLRNVVRAAFGIYNFEFRNKKIGFNIPDELLLHYLAQRHDLTNFVIEIGQENLNEVSQNNGMMQSSSAENFMASDSTMRFHENDHILNVNRQEFGDPFDSKQLKYPVGERQNVYSNVSETVEKDNAYQEYSDQVSRSELQSTTDDRTDPKTEQSQFEIEQQYKLKVDDNQNEQNHGPQIFYPRPTFKISDDVDVNAKKVNYQQHSFSPCEMNRFRKRGERMSKDQKEVYVKYFEENPCMLAQRRNDSVLESHWNKLAAILNNVPQGAIKNVEEWKQTFDAWRYRVFMYYRYNYKLAGSVTHKVKNFKPLTSTDQRAYSMWTSFKNISPRQSDKGETVCSPDATQASYNY